MKSYFITVILILLFFNVGLCQINKHVMQAIGIDTKKNSIPKRFNLSQVNNYGNFTSCYYLNSFNIPNDSKYKLDSVFLQGNNKINFKYDLNNRTIEEKTIANSPIDVSFMKYDANGYFSLFKKHVNTFDSLTFKIVQSNNRVDSINLIEYDGNNKNVQYITKTSFTYINGNIIKTMVR